MKKIYLLLIACIAFLNANSTTYTIDVVSISYSPNSITCAPGDMVIITASSFHPCNQVDLNTWNAGGSSPVAGGWGSQTSTFTFVAVSSGTVYFACQQHSSLGMKGQIIVSGVGINETAANFLNNYNLFPNPATSNVKVSFGLTETSTVNIKLFNVAGQEVKVFVSDLNLGTGSYEYNFELPSGIASGNYFIEVSSGTRKSTKKLLVSK